MGKFSHGMIKYGNLVGNIFEFDRKEAKRVKKENKLNNGEQLATAPLRMLTEPLIGLTVGTGIVS